MLRHLSHEKSNVHLFFVIHIMTVYLLHDTTLHLFLKSQCQLYIVVYHALSKIFHHTNEHLSQHCILHQLPFDIIFGRSQVLIAYRLHCLCAL